MSREEALEKKKGGKKHRHRFSKGVCKECGEEEKELEHEEKEIRNEK